jgi:hypothetical protein
MKLAIQAGILAVAVSLSGYAQQRRLSMSGVVTDWRSHKPIEGAQVTVVGNGANPTTTDGDGGFRVGSGGRCP